MHGLSAYMAQSMTSGHQLGKSFSIFDEEHVSIYASAGELESLDNRMA